MHTTIQLVATGGCDAAPDQSGNQFVFDTDKGRRIAVVCPQNASQAGCDASGCFPGASTVLLNDGQSKPMFDLRLGDEVAVMGKKGAFNFDAVYAFGHNDPKPYTSFVKLNMHSPWSSPPSTFDWFLDTALNALGVPGWLPVAYQVVLSPARLLYSIMGKETYVRLYNVLDAKLVGGIAGLGTQFGAAIFTGSACILGGIAAATASKIVYFR
ncbi:hypothetical protein WJX75_001290 [Coccomyxa subellipsoidea]|uniref:Hedgehog protein Hint domain-containing protein n=1 Tax=Coccomyxa subellipsoidea TaxID=248742 RepID=A0ABR2YZP9_9CHLO